jgi:hypothetical protein
MTIYTSKYKPVSTAETAANSALSVRLVRDLEAGINNAKAYVFSHKIRHCALIPSWSSIDSNTDENVMAVFAPPFIPMGYRYLRWYIGGKRIAGTGTTTWRLYTSSLAYCGGPLVMDISRLGSYDVDSLVVNSDSHDIYTSGDLRINRAKSLVTWLTLTSQNEAGSRATITSIDIVPRLVSS